MSVRPCWAGSVKIKTHITMKKSIYFRVKPESNGYSPEHFDTVEKAIERANERNQLRIDTTNSNDKETFVWNGDNCKIYKVTEIVEPLNMVERNRGKEEGKVRLPIQIHNGKDWETTSKNWFDFDNWSEAVRFAYRLASIHQKEVRIEHKGNGHYYNPCNSDSYLKDDLK